MKYFFLAILFFAYGFFLPTMSSMLQIIGSLIGLFVLVVGTIYYIDTRVNAVRS